jgi:hypothetical protein
VDYTSIQLVKEELDITGPAKDGLLSRLVTAASRTVDQICAGSIEAVNYFELETVADEELSGKVDNHGILTAHPHKPVLSSVSALSYRFQPWDTWVEVSQFGKEKTWVKGNVPSLRSCEVQVKCSYVGGFATTLDALPPNLVEAATVLAGRFYREDESGLTDAIGVAELGTIMYTKAMPIRVREMLRPFKRPVPW